MFGGIITKFLKKKRIGLNNADVKENDSLIAKNIGFVKLHKQKSPWGLFWFVCLRIVSRQIVHQFKYKPTNASI